MELRTSISLPSLRLLFSCVKRDDEEEEDEEEEDEGVRPDEVSLLGSFEGSLLLEDKLVSNR